MKVRQFAIPWLHLATSLERSGEMHAHVQKQPPPPPSADEEHCAKVLPGGITSTTTMLVSSFRPPCARRMDCTTRPGAACRTENSCHWLNLSLCRRICPLSGRTHGPLVSYAGDVTFDGACQRGCELVCAATHRHRPGTGHDRDLGRLFKGVPDAVARNDQPRALRRQPHLVHIRCHIHAGRVCTASSHFFCLVCERKHLG